MSTILETAGLFLTRAEFAELLRVTPATLINWQERSHGPTPVLASEKKVLYRTDDVRAFLAAGEPAPPKIDAEIAKAADTARHAERERVVALHLMTPPGAEAVRDRAIADGLSVEAFRALVTSGEPR